MFKHFRSRTFPCFLIPLAFATGLYAQMPAANGNYFQPGVLPKQWATGGPKCMEMPEWQVHEYNPDFYILRQSGCTDYEKPFVFLLFGKQSALLLDTGSHHGNIAPTLQQVVKKWLLRNERASIPLLVTHSHSHWDHVDGDDAIEALHDPAMPVTMVKATPEALKKAYKISKWPEEIGSVDLGDRVIDAIPLPGHDVAAIAYYDRKTAVLFTGDSVNAGRIFVDDWDAFVKSNQRMIDFTKDKPVSFLLGCHIEQTRTPYKDYPFGTMYQPDEAPLELARGELLEIQRAVDATDGKPRVIAMPWYTIRPLSVDQQLAPARKAEIDRIYAGEKKLMWDHPAN
jgi:hydroxyacylglutathione hydrolase